MGFKRLVAEKMAYSATHWIGAHFGESFPFYYVSEFPKSGGTWVAGMVSDYLRLPFPQRPIFPVGCRALIQNHWRYDRRLKRVFFVYRDGRDAMTSYFFHRLRIARHSSSSGQRATKRIYENLLGENYDAGDVVRLMPRFIEYEFKHPGRGSTADWATYVTEWWQASNKQDIAYLSYEQLLADCAGTLSRAVSQHSDAPIDEWQLHATVEKFSMARATGRKPGQEDQKAHIRKGVAGDWQNNFSREAAEVFDDLAGDALVMLGYEPDRQWVDRYTYPTP